jgi:DNA polymerase elongation subunit (family B)
MEFQIIDWFCRDEKSNRLVDDNTINEGYVIHLFGCNEQGESVHAKIKNFKPYFFIKVPKWFKKRHVEILQDYLKQEIYYKHRENIVSCQLQKRTDFNGYHPEPEKFVVVHFHNLGAFYSLKRMFKDGQMIKTIPELTTSPIRFNSYEANLDPMLRFIHVTNIQPAGWVHIDKYKNGKMANTKIDIETEWMHVHPYENESVAPLKQASFDIECTAGDGVSFPEYTNINDPVIQIGTTVYIYGHDNSKPLKHIICLGKTDPIEGAIVESYETEKEVLLAWTKFIRKLDPDIITGYNIYGFDFRYLYERAKLLGIEEKFSLLGRLRGEQSVLQEKKLSSSALGFNEMHILPMIGRLEIDLFKVIQRDYKFESYKLDAVSAEFIKGKISDVKQTKTFTNIVTNPNGLNVGNYISILANGYKYVNPSDGRKKFKILAIKDDRVRIEKIKKPEGKLQWCLAKDDVSPKDIFRLQKGSSEDRCVVAKYCIQDNILCNELMDKLDIIVNHIGMANVCYVPMNFLFLRGQGIKAYSLVARQCRLEKYLIPDLRKTRDSEYQGATVLEAQVGGHFYPVACNDFASLYPSSMISHNLSPDTLITKPEDLKNVPHQTIEISANEKYHFLLPEETSEEDKHNPEIQRNRKGRGILPRILIHLLQSRKDVKKRMAKETNPFKKSLLDGLQLSYKLTCNSIYGQCGSSVSAIACKPVASACTCIGRELLEFAGNKAKALYPNGEIVYGDSVLPTTLVTVKKDNQIFIKEIQEISKEWYDYSNFKNRKLIPHFKELINNVILENKLPQENIFEDNGRILKTNYKYFYGGSCYLRNDERYTRYIVYFRNKEKNINLRKSFSIFKYGHERAKELAKKHQEKMSDHFGLTRKIKIELKKDDVGKYYKIYDYLYEKSFYFDYEDYDIFEKNYSFWFKNNKTNDNYYIHGTDNKIQKGYHEFIMNKYIDQLPKYIKFLIQKNRTIDHINRCGFDNRKRNLRYASKDEQSFNKILENNKHQYRGISDKIDCIEKLRCRIFYKKKLYQERFSTKEQCISYLEYMNEMIIDDLNKDMLEFKNKLFNFIDKDYSSNRKFKEQSSSSYQILGSKDFVNINKVIRHKTKKKIYKISTSSSYVEVTEDHSLLDENRNLIKPSECKIGTKLLMNPNIYNNISFPSEKIQNHYEHFLKNPSNIITNIELLCEKYYGYVYDIETTEGNFQAGLGNIICANTDSVMYKYPLPETLKTKKEKLEHAMKCAKVVEKVVSEELPWPHNFEYEKIYYPYILYSKKRYSGVMYEFDLDNYSKIDNKGIVLKRRDNAKIVKYIFGGCLNIILFEQDVEKALKFMYKSVEEMFQGKFDIGMFIISKALKETTTIKSKCYLKPQQCKDNNHLPHIHPIFGKTAPPAQGLLAIRMGQRDPGNAPQWNDRIPYVYVYVDKETTRDMLNEYNKDIVEKTKKRKKLLQGDLIEHPEYVQQNNLKLDYLFYLTNQLTNPLTQLFGIFENIGQTEFKDIEEEIKLKEKAFTKRIMKPLERKYKNRQDGIQTLDVFFKKK